MPGERQMKECVKEIHLLPSKEEKDEDGEELVQSQNESMNQKWAEI